MKITIAACLIVLSSFSAWADEYIDSSGNWTLQLPPRIVTTDGNVVSPVTLEDFIAAGGHVATAEEIAQRDAAKAQAQEEDSVYADIEPATFAPRMAGTNVLGQSQLMFDADNEAYGVTDTGSPKHTAEEKAAGRAAHDSKKAAKKAAKEAVLSSAEPNNVKAMWAVFTNYVAAQ